MKKIIIIILLIFGLFAYNSSIAADDSKLLGRILLQVEDNGEAWYINPTDSKRYYLGLPKDAFKIMRDLGIGITNYDLAKIPIGLEYISGNDADGDGLNNKLEEAIGTRVDVADTDQDTYNDFIEIETANNPLGQGKLFIDKSFANKHLGKIFLQVESKGEAWYIYPVNGKRYFLGSPIDAFNLMRTLGLGITNDDLGDLKSKDSSFVVKEVEKQIHDLVNIEREKNGLKSLAWNSELARVAREHSENLAQENLNFTKFGMSCDYPLIHHEGTSFGFYSTNRLNNRQVYYFSKVAENIALLSRASFKVSYRSDEPLQAVIDECQNTRTEWDNEFKNKLDSVDTEEEKRIILEAEKEKRQKEFKNSFAMNIKEVEWYTNEFLATESVQGWMESPGHRANILDSDYDEAGIGVAFTDGYFIVSQVFIKRAECGFKGGECCVKEGYYPYCYVPLSCDDSICG